MTLDLETYLDDTQALQALSDEDLQALTSQILTIQQTDRKEMQLRYYLAASETARLVHFSFAGTVGLGGGNRASKTDTFLAELSALATGIFPKDPELAEVFRKKFKGPIRIRIVLESLTTTMHPVILHKLQWWKWNGISEPGGELGHWGWIPKCCLKDGIWAKSWSEKLRTLTVLCRDPDNFDNILGESIFQIMGHDQDPSVYASGSFHEVMHDEPPPRAIWSENRARVLDMDGRLSLVMTWPDDPSIPVDWIFDEVYEPGSPGPLKNPEIDWFELNTLDNRNLIADRVLKKSAGWSEAEKSVRLRGQPIRFSNLIHPLFTDYKQTWCFTCNEPRSLNDEAKCTECGSLDVTKYCHVENFTHSQAWPCIFLLDPHPRKPHMFMWVQVDPSDDLHVVAEGECDASPVEVRKLTEEIETSLNLNTVHRLMDPNMGASPASARERDISWQDEFALANLWCELAVDSAVGRSRVNEYLKPDSATHRPRLRFHERCQSTIQQFKRYAWDEFRRSADRDVKQLPRDKYDDFPTLFISIPI